MWRPTELKGQKGPEGQSWNLGYHAQIIKKELIIKVKFYQKYNSMVIYI